MIEVKDQLPSGLTFIEAFPPQGTTFDDNSLTWNVPILDKDESLSLVLRARVDANAVQQNCAQVTSAIQNDTDSTPNNGYTQGEDDDSCAVVTPREVVGSLGDFVFEDTNGNGSRTTTSPASAT
ncbi:MAG: hypothetical protein RhofKO_04850 [Rhodothermales bacterium]